MATATIPAAVPEPNDPPGTTPSSPSSGLFSSMIAPVEPARPAFDLSPSADTTNAAEAPSAGASSAAYHSDDNEAESKSNSDARIQQKSIWKAWLLAGATRWAKGGGTENKRLDVAKAKATAQRTKEDRKISINRSEGFSGKPGMNVGPGNNSGVNKGNSSGSGKGPLKNLGSEHSKGHQNSNGNAHQGYSGSSGGNGGPGAGGAGRGSSGEGSGGGHGAGTGRTPKNDRTDAGHDQKPKADPTKDNGQGAATGGKSGAPGPAGSAGKNGSTKETGSATGKTDRGADPRTGSGKAGAGASTADGKQASGKVDFGEDPKGEPGKSDQTNGGPGKSGSGQPNNRTPLQKSRETGHGDGGTVRNVIDHVKAYADGARDGYHDKKDKNAKEHARLDKAHDKYKAKTADPKKAGKGEAGKTPAPLQAKVGGQTVTITDDDGPMEDPFMSKPTPIQAQGIDAKKITLGDSFLKESVSRGELRTFKQYEMRLEGRIDGLAKVVDATKALIQQAVDQADECQQVAEQAKGVKGGEKLVAELNKLADAAKAQAEEAREVHKRAQRAHDFGKSVLSNIQTRYAPLYQAVVDSDEVKPAELKFYGDRGVYPTDHDLAA